MGYIKIMRKIGEKIKVLIVDDSPYSRQTIKKIVESALNFDVIAMAANGKEAISRLFFSKPDVVLLDIEMPEMDGFSFLRWMLHNHPVPVIVVSSRNDTQSVFRCLDFGAVDFVSKPTATASKELESIAGDLIEKINALADLGMEKVKRRVDLLSQSVRVAGRRVYSGTVDLVSIGASTGGPLALQVVLSALPADFMAPIVVSQHMPAGFTRPFAERLNRLCSLRVKEASDKDIMTPGCVLIAPGDRNMIFERRRNNIVVRMVEPSASDRHVPSVDVMMSCAAQEFGANTSGILLTGMGNDGCNGMLEIVKKGGYTIAESEETAVIFGMPQEAIVAQAVSKVLPLEEIPGEMLRICQGDHGNVRTNTRT